MSEHLKKAMMEYNDAVRMFNYAFAQIEIDVAIMLMEAANIKIKALRYIPEEVYNLESISEV
jgi:hypothetical protein